VIYAQCSHGRIAPDSDIFYQLYEQDSCKSQGIAG